jgi:hypothetical protein
MFGLDGAAQRSMAAKGHAGRLACLQRDQGLSQGLYPERYLAHIG